MPIDPVQNWYLKKHESGEVFGPVRFEKIQEWAFAAQVSPQDLVSNDQVIWTRPPMIPELEMDWLAEVGESLLYGPTTSGALLEFVTSGEISKDTRLINCVTGAQIALRDTKFFKSAIQSPPHEHAGSEAAQGLFQQPLKGGIRANLQRRVRELEQAILEKQQYLNAAKDVIARLEARNRELEDRLRDLSGLPPKKKG